MFARSSRLDLLSSPWGLPATAKSILRDGDADAIEKLWASATGKLEGANSQSPAWRYLTSAKELLCALAQTETLKGRPETWTPTWEQARVLHRAVGLMDDLMARRVADGASAVEVAAGGAVTAAQWQRLLVDYRVRKNRLIESILDWA